MYKFLESTDNLGIPHESPAYIKRSCNHCYGRGYRTFLKNHSKGEALTERHNVACLCVLRGYDRARREAERADAKARREAKEVANNPDTDNG